MGVVLRNDDLVGGIDSALVAKIGSAPLQTTAQDLSGAVNELVNSSSDVSVTQKVSSGENIASITIDGTTTELYATDTTYSDFTGSTSQTAGAHGLVPAPTTSDTNKYLKGDGTWSTVDAGSDVTVIQKVSSGENIASITVDGTTTELYATEYTAATSAPSDIDTTGAVGTSTNYARQDHTHKIALATGDNNGQVKIAGTNVSVKGLNNSAYKDYTTSVTSGSNDLVTSGAVYTAIDNLPEPMVYKGTLGENGTITTLPTASASNNGYTYKVITAGTYAGITAKVGDVFSSTGTEWTLFQCGDTDTDTWRNIKVNGTEKLASGISSGAVDFVNGTNTTVSFDATGNKISISATDTTYSDFGGATSQQAGSAGLVPAPTTSDTAKFLKGDGTWGTVSTSDVNVTQSPVSTNANYELLFSGTADNTEHTETVGKNNNLLFNPSSGNITIGGVLTDKNGMQSIKRISETDYQALSTAEKNNGTIYHRYDATASASLDTNVSQTENSANADYEVLLSNSASTTTEICGVKKSAGLKFNPSTGNMSISSNGLALTHGNSDIVLSGTDNVWYDNKTSLKDAVSSLNNSLTQKANKTWTALTGEINIANGDISLNQSINNFSEIMIILYAIFSGVSAARYSLVLPTSLLAVTNSKVFPDYTLGTARTYFRVSLKNDDNTKLVIDSSSVNGANVIQFYAR